MARVQNIRGGGPSDGPHLGTDEARQASRTGFMWRVLALSLVFGVLVVIGAWLWAEARHPPRPPGEGAQVRVVAPPRAAPPPAKAAPDQVVRPSPQGRDSGT